MEDINIETIFANGLTKLIRKIVKQEVENVKFDNHVPAQVTAVSQDNTRLSLRILGSSGVITNIRNDTGQTIAVSDCVYVLKIKNDLSNCVADIKIDAQG